MHFICFRHLDKLCLEPKLMMENSGAKPKTVLGAGAGAGNGRHTQPSHGSAALGQVSGLSQQTSDNGLMPPADGPVGQQKETPNGYGPSGTTALLPSPRMPERNRSNNNRNSSHGGSGDGTSLTRRGSMPNSVARSRLPPIDHRTGPLHFEARRFTPSSHLNEPNTQRPSRRENGDRQMNRHTQLFGRPMLRHRSLSSQNPTYLQRDNAAVAHAAAFSGSNGHSRTDPPLVDSTDTSNATSAVPTFRTSIQQIGIDNSLSSEDDEPSSNDQLNRPASAASDAGFARQLLQEEMDAILRADEELARELHDDLNFMSQPWFNQYPIVDRDHGVSYFFFVCLLPFN